MKNKAWLWLGIAAFVVLAAIIGAAHKAPSAQRPVVSGMPTISAFDAEGGTFYVTGSSMSRVEIWSIPADTDGSEKDYKEIGGATLATTTDSIQVWTLPVPAQPIDAAQIFAQGFGGGADSADAPARMILPYHDAADLQAALWPTATATVSQ